MKVSVDPQSLPAFNPTRHSDINNNLISTTKPTTTTTTTTTTDNNNNNNNNSLIIKSTRVPIRRLKRNGAPVVNRVKRKVTSRRIAAIEVVDIGQKRGNKSTKAVSSRNLAAGLWRMMTATGETRTHPLGFKPAVGHLGIPFIFQCNGKTYGSQGNNPAQSPSPCNAAKNAFFRKMETSIPLPNHAMEGATKWDPNPVYFNPTNEVHHIYSHRAHMKLDQQLNAVSVISALESELEQARTRIEELLTERRTTKKKLEHFVQKVSEEKLAWRSREHEKIRAVIIDIKSELNRERKNSQRMEIVNSKLVKERGDYKLTAKRYMQEYEKEKKARILMEEVCDELAKEIGDDKTEIEEFKRESTKYRDEVEEERRMLQMAEVWREERVQMKLVDAKVALSEKYSQMNYLVAELENFLRSRNVDLNMGDIKKAELLQEAATQVNVRETKEFMYEPPNSDDIFSVFEDLNFGDSNEKESDASKNIASPEVNMNKKYSSEFADEDSDLDDGESGWETASHLEDRGSSYSPETPITEISEVCSESRQKKKGSSIARLWRSISKNGEENYKIISVEGINGILSNGRLSTNTEHSSLDSISCNGGEPSPDLVGQWHRDAQKNSLKSKLPEARVESQKVQIRHVLKQKI